MTKTYEYGHALDEGRNIRLVRGDSKELVLVLDGEDREDGAEGQLLFGIRHGATGELLHRQALRADSRGRARMWLSSRVTAALPEGRHYYGVRYVREGDTRGLDGLWVRSPFMRRLTVLPGAADVREEAQ